MEVIKSVKPSGTYYEVVLLQPIQFRPDEPARPAGDKVIVDEMVADMLSAQGLAALLFWSEDQSIWVPV